MLSYEGQVFKIRVSNPARETPIHVYRTPRRYQDPVLRAWLKCFLPLTDNTLDP